MVLSSLVIEGHISYIIDISNHICCRGVSVWLFFLIIFQVLTLKSFEGKENKLKRNNSDGISQQFLFIDSHSWIMCYEILSLFLVGFSIYRQI